MMNEAEQPLATGGDVENSGMNEKFIEQFKQLTKEQKQVVIKIQKSLLDEARKELNPTFRGNIIHWIEYSDTNSIVDAREAKKKDDTKRKYGIRWNGTIYKPEDFLKTAFPEYKKCNYLIIFKNDNIFYLGRTERVKLQYEALKYIYTEKERSTLVGISVQDNKEL